MIKLQDLTPTVYYEQSRDFQFIGRLYDLVLNYIKTNAANLYNLPSGKNMDEQLLNLLALTLGFKPTKKYNSKQLRAICSVLPTILKSKGSIQALVLATNALLAAEGVSQPLDYTIVPKESITLYITQELDDLTLFTDLLDYLLPAGLSCNIIKESQLATPATTILGFSDQIKLYYQDENLVSTMDEDALTKIGIGLIGITPSIIANTTVIKQPSNNNVKTEPTTETDPSLT